MRGNRKPPQIKNTNRNHKNYDLFLSPRVKQATGHQSAELEADYFLLYEELRSHSVLMVRPLA